jgi:hypothetical protein
MYAKDPRLVRTGGNHAPLLTPHNHGLAAQGGVVHLLYRCKKGIHVYVDDHGNIPGLASLRGKASFYRLLFYFVNTGLKDGFCPPARERPVPGQQPAMMAVAAHLREILPSGKEELFFTQ